MQNELTKDLNQEAIKAAVANNWPLAIEHNLTILESDPLDVAALNRLGIAYSMSQKNSEAMKTFQKALELDSRNQIAKNNISRLKINKSSGLMNRSLQSTVSFIEEPGKSKVIPLVSQGEPKVFSEITIGEEVNLVANKHKIKIVSDNKQFIGYLPDNIAHRMIELLNAGYKYKTTIKSVNPKLPAVFIQETHSSKKLKGAPSFPLDDTDHLPSLSAGDSSETPPLEIFDPMAGDEN
jgi:tetratricopeptide (TPR) repeat protein